MILIDSNILIDLFGKHPEWLEWSVQQLRVAKAQDQLAINPVIYAELSSAFHTTSELDSFLSPAGIKVMPLSNAASFAAGHASIAYRKRKGEKTGVLAEGLERPVHRGLRTGLRAAGLVQGARRERRHQRATDLRSRSDWRSLHRAVRPGFSKGSGRQFRYPRATGPACL